MKKSNGKSDGRRSLRWWVRHAHRWLGLTAIVFVLMLSMTGIALNHAGDWRLDRRYVDWNWLLDAYGIRAPRPAASFADGVHRATQLGGNLYFDDRQLSQQIDTLTGMIMVGPLAVLTTGGGVLVVTLDGDFVQSIDLAGELTGPILRAGRRDGRPVIHSNGEFFIGDGDVTHFERVNALDPHSVTWSVATPPPAETMASLERAWRGRGLTVERVLTDLHSGRIVGRLGPLLMDLVAAALIVLALSGLLVWSQRRDRYNGNGNGKHRQQG